MSRGLERGDLRPHAEAIRARYAEGNISLQGLAELYGARSRGSIYAIIQGRSHAGRPPATKRTSPAVAAFAERLSQRMVDVHAAQKHPEVGPLLREVRASIHGALELVNASRALRGLPPITRHMLARRRVRA